MRRREPVREVWSSARLVDEVRRSGVPHEMPHDVTSPELREWLAARGFDVLDLINASAALVIAELPDPPVLRAVSP